MIVQPNNHQLRAGLAGRRAIGVSNYEHGEALSLA
jgi:hypothetical protein